MAIHPLLAGKFFDPETIGILNAAFEGACADLGVTEKMRHSRVNLAKMVLKIADGQRDPQAIRAAVVSVLRSRH